MKGKKTEWTPEMISKLKQEFPTRISVDIAKELNLSLRTIEENFIEELQRHHHPFTEEEIQMLLKVEPHLHCFVKRLSRIGGYTDISILIQISKEAFNLTRTSHLNKDEAVEKLNDLIRKFKVITDKQFKSGGNA